jgi:hypothetical protein
VYDAADAPRPSKGRQEINLIGIVDRNQLNFGVCEEMTRVVLALSFGSSDWPCSSGFNAGELPMKWQGKWK